MGKTLISFKNIGKSFGGVRALSGVTFDVEAGEIHAIVGENGAGKSTLLKILSGQIQLYEGEVQIEGRKVFFKKPADALALGINMVHQELNLCLNMNIVDNIFLGKEKLYSKKEKEDLIINSMEELDIELSLNAPVRFFSVAQKQMIEIIKSTITETKLLIMDEPTSALNMNEVKKLFELITKLKNKGVTILFVSHRLEEVLQIADRVTVLRDGQFIKTDVIQNLTKDIIISLMVGRTIEQKVHEKRDFSDKAPLLQVKNLTREPYYKNCSFDVKAGEILGIAGLEGCGRYELVETLYGMIRRYTGEIFIEGIQIKPRSPMDAIKRKIGYVDRERKERGILTKMDLTSNVMITRGRNKFRIKRKEMDTEATELLQKIRVKYNNVHQLITSLSGGNQQKCIIARLLADDPKIFIMEEPTRGIDVGSKQEIFTIIKELANNGKAIIIISSELPELINECDRILVMSNGRITGEVFATETNQEELMALATIES
jgi:ABC-type sugar transport system ATPase subunit